MIKKKASAHIILSLIIASLLVLVTYFAISIRSDDVFDTRTNNGVIPILLSFEYDDTNTDTSIDVSHIFSVVLLVNPSNKRVGILEFPSYIGVYDDDTKVVVPIDYYFMTSGFSAYIRKVKALLKVQDLQYMYIDNNSMANFVDLLGGLDIFLIDDAIQLSANIGDGVSINTNVGIQPLDGVLSKKLLSVIENSKDEELLKSAKRKEFILAILRQLQQETDAYVHSKQMLTILNNQINTSFSTKSLQKIIMLLADYNFEQVYFQRISGRLQSIDLSTLEKDNIKFYDYLANTKILFTSLEIGNLSNVYASLRDKVLQEQSDKITDKITISIFNGTVFNGLARNTKALYEAAGFEVVSVDNAASNDVENTTIIDRIGNIIQANFAAQIIGVKSVITDITSIDKAGADLTLILGKDFDGKRYNKWRSY